MKAVQVTMDENLLRRLDDLDEVKKKGRSALFRRLAEAYLQHRRNLEIRAAYQRGYGSHPVADLEFDIDPERIAWPDD